MQKTITQTATQACPLISLQLHETPVGFVGDTYVSWPAMNKLMIFMIRSKHGKDTVKAGMQEPGMEHKALPIAVVENGEEERSLSNKSHCAEHTSGSAVD